MPRANALIEEVRACTVCAKSLAAGPRPIVQFSADRLGEYQRMARTLRAEGVGAEVFPDAKKVGQQLKYAAQRGFLRECENRKDQHDADENRASQHVRSHGEPPSESSKGTLSFELFYRVNK